MAICALTLYILQMLVHYSPCYLIYQYQNDKVWILLE